MTWPQKLREFVREWNKQRRMRRRAASRLSYPYELGILGIMKNESLNIDEWISHYLALGCQKIYLIDNGSTDDTVAKAQVWVDMGLIEMIQLPQPHRQTQHYWTAIKHFKIRSFCNWLLIADLDEFWFCPDGSKISDKLLEFDDLNVIYANWRMFGSHGTDHPKSIRETITRSDPKLQIHAYTKYICRTNVLVAQRMLGIHKVRHANSSKTVSDNHNFNLNHYPIQSLQFFQSVKMKRGDAHHKTKDDVRDMDYFKRSDAACTQENRLLADLVTRGQLGKGPF